MTSMAFVACLPPRQSLSERKSLCLRRLPTHPWNLLNSQTTSIRRTIMDMSSNPSSKPPPSPNPNPSHNQKPRASSGFRLLEKSLAFGVLVRTAKYIWHTFWLVMMNELAPSSKSTGEYIRPLSQFRNRIECDANPNAEPKFPAQCGRYKVYVGKACPWCHRVLITIALLGLNDAIEVVLLEPSDSGVWKLAQPTEKDRDIKDVYRNAMPDYVGRCTAPVLVDIVRNEIVCNESADIVRNLVQLGRAPFLQDKEEENYSDRQRTDSWTLVLSEDNESASNWEELIQSTVNNGVYKAGFSRNQAAYDKAIDFFFSTLDQIERKLSTSRYILGNQVSVADIFLFPTLFRLDAVYALIFKVTLRSINNSDHYPNIQQWMRDMYQLPGVAETCDLQGTLNNYFAALFPLNPSGIVPRVESIDWMRPHERATRFRN